MSKSIRIGGASGFWGDSVVATPQLLNNNNLDFIVYDYLAEITMSIMARARAKDPEKGYAIDFVSSVLKLNLRQISKIFNVQLRFYQMLAVLTLRHALKLYVNWSLI